MFAGEIERAGPHTRDADTGSMSIGSASRLAHTAGHSSARMLPRLVAANNTLPTSTGQRDGTKARSSMSESR